MGYQIGILIANHTAIKGRICATVYGGFM